MRALLDTHVWLWMLAEPERLSPTSRALLASSDNKLYLSAASSWEIAVKYALGRLSLPADPRDLVPSWIVETRVEPLPIEHHHALAAGALPPHHRDPFDRMLVAQALAEGIPLMSADRQLHAYDVELLAP